jgi:hypothetical protein
MSNQKKTMRYYQKFIAAILIISALSSCKKRKDVTADCSPNSPTVRKVTNAQATIKKDQGKYFIIEKGSIDSKLNPCALPEEYQINDFSITVSGDVKETHQSNICCTENFLITKISK